MNIENDLDRLSQNKILQSFLREYKINEMVTVYYSDSTASYNHGVYCALVPSSKIENILSGTTWNLSHGDGLPGAVQYYQDGNKVKYLRFGNDSGIEPLVIDREFYGMRDDYKEISEEFRLFHRLYHDKKTEQYIKIDDHGDETIVAIIEKNRVQIRLKEIRQFLAIREMHLVLQFDCREHSMYSLKDLGVLNGGNNYQHEFACWGLYYGDFGLSENKSFSRLLGKRLIQPLPKSKSGFWGFAEDTSEKFVDFIVDMTEDGDEISFTSDPDSLSNHFVANPDAPHYLTPVHFSKQVLDKYYQNPSKYSVEDSYLRCGALWGVQIDNHHKDKVCVWLGDLGRDLPYNEQLYWRSYNISPEGKVSDTYFKRQIQAEFTYSERIEHIFTNTYYRVQNMCKEYLDWQFLLPLSNEDEHYLKCIRIPSTNEQRDFDELILGLTKILVDSLNEKELNKYIQDVGQTDIKGSISLLEIVFQTIQVKNFDEHIIFLRNLQNLRSSSSAHRKGSNYRKISKKFDIDSQTLSAVLEKIMRDAISFLDFLDTIIQNGQLKSY